MTAITVGERLTYDVTTMIDIVTRFKGGTFRFAGARNALIPAFGPAGRNPAVERYLDGLPGMVAQDILDVFR